MSSREAQQLIEKMNKTIAAANQAVAEEERLSHFLVLAIAKARTERSLRRKLEVRRVESELRCVLGRAASLMLAAELAQQDFEEFLERANEEPVVDEGEQNNANEESAGGPGAAN
ncbi:unnamed protein product [Caenorhabditis auriculariae]|uniref:Uncharacterized protein n=1 Tax=Caenorhabditis auriculariae TaxID=2777116 RepID=A0A8S1H940_9PELO|nr:unnamed protein product [Caenorhabditis auriculariae]